MSTPRRRRAGRPSAAESAGTRDRILAAARECFASSGFPRTSNQQVADAAGVTPAALYHWFDGKADLYGAVYDACLDVLLAAYERAGAEHARCADRLATAFEANIALNRAHPGLAEFLALASVELIREPELRERTAARGEAVAELFGRWLAEGAAAGELRADLDLATTERLLTATSLGLSWYHRYAPTSADHDAMLRAFADVIRGWLREN